MGQKSKQVAILVHCNTNRANRRFIRLAWWDKSNKKANKTASNTKQKNLDQIRS
jgi:hypothetical protein